MGLPGVITMYEDGDTGKAAVLDGQHRIGDDDILRMFCQQLVGRGESTWADSGGSDIVPPCSGQVRSRSWPRRACGPPPSNSSWRCPALSPSAPEPSPSA